MKNITGKLTGSLPVILAYLFLSAGCAGTEPVLYYQLSTVETARNVPFGGETGEMVLGIGPVRLPEYLDRPQLVTRLTANRLQLADSHRWAEPLSENIPRVLRENLSTLLGTDRVILYPWPSSSAMNYQLVVEVLNFENKGDGAASLVARWSVKGTNGKIVLPEKRSSFLVSAASRDQEALVGALNETLGLFCREVAQAMISTQATPGR